jgi:iron complex outermembrane receptor protein
MRTTRIHFATMVRCSVSHAALALVLSAVAVPVAAAAAAAATAAAQDAQSPSGNPNQEIVIIAPPLFRDITPERALDEEAISSYGVSTIDELLGEVQVELGEEDETPLILVNGKRINDLSEIGALPVEALRGVVVLPRGSAVRAGGTPGQRVISLTLNRKVISETLTAAEKVATDGDWHSERGEAIVTRVRGDTRINVTLRARDESDLFESERGIIQPAPRLPFALSGNVIGYPNTTGEIDPLLSALAGQVVTVTPVPSIANPTLSDFVAGANNPAVTDLGQFRTLRPKTRNYDLNGTFATRLASWLTGSATVRLGRSLSDSKRGLPSAVFVLSPDNPFSPFSRDVGLAFYGPDPLRYRSRHDSGEGNVTLDADLGKWIGNFHARHVETKDVSRSERQNTFGAIPLDDSVNPFTTDLSSLISIRTDRTSADSVENLAELSLTGPALTLPAGDVQVTIEGRLDWNHLRTFSTFSLINPHRNFSRSEQSIRGAVDVPLTSRDTGFLHEIGNLDATAEYSRDHYSDAGTLNHYAFGLTWEPIPMLRLHGDLESTESPPPIEILGDPVVVTPDVRVFDPLTGETVDVTQITGGNPDLQPQTTRIKRLGGILRLVPRLNLQLNAEYTDTDRRNFLSSLPSASAAVELAFPDRFIRDSNGVLTTVDLRPVNFDSDREKRLRWGFSMNTKLGGGAPPGTPGAPRGPHRPSTYFQLTANDTIVFSDKIIIRPGLGSVDLLKGGAIGIGGGRLRHQLDATASLTSGGLGARAGITWRGKSTLQSRIGGVTDTLQFSSLMVINLRLFADAGRVMPRQKWAKGMRLSLDVLNLTNDRQRVRDSFGNTPLQYQPGYRDPLGRTIEIELRKVF